jgi:hypothetical protein
MTIEGNQANYPKPILPKKALGSSSNLLDYVAINPRDVRGSIMGPSAKFQDAGLKLMDLDPLEVARQLTLMEHELFMSIKVDLYLLSRGSCLIALG